MSVGRLPDSTLDTGRPLGREFASLGLGGYRQAARHVRSLPYGRNSDRSDWRLVLKEGRGTCSANHALLAELARESGRYVAPLFVFDAGYDPVRLQRNLEGCRAQILVRLHSGRTFYAEPEPPPKRPVGRPFRHGAKFPGDEN